jgi:hypothetical protein
LEAFSPIERITSLFHAPPMPANRPWLVKLAVPSQEGAPHRFRIERRCNALPQPRRHGSLER